MIPLSGARVALVVGDVVGHGIRASATMGRLRTALRTLADIDLPPDELLTHLDDLVLRLGADSQTNADTTAAGDVGATCLYAVYDPVSGCCHIARAGHPAPVVDEAGTTGDAQQSRRIARELLQPLSALPAVRLVVGTRRAQIPSLRHAVRVLDLDVPEHVTRDDITAYARAVHIAREVATGAAMASVHAHPGRCAGALTGDEHPVGDLR